VAAIRGDAETARRHADEVLERAAIAGLATPPGVVVQALALLDLAGGRWDEAADRFGSVSRARVGVSSLIVAVMSAADRVEAAVRAGRREEADEALALFTAWSAGSSARWAPPLLAACRGLVADAPDEAERHYAEAIALEAQARPFDRARIRLLYGEHLRRARRRLDARVHLRAAIDGFDRLDAEPWSARARGELRASGETARRRDAGTRGDLTPQERQVAQLVADGLTNKEVAAQLFLSPRTVDAHLRSVFAKLGVSSRTQLARRLPAAAEPAPA
jgi:DNA-binding CsgD family transcriptional regulator